MELFSGQLCLILVYILSCLWLDLYVENTLFSGHIMFYTSASKAWGHTRITQPVRPSVYLSFVCLSFGPSVCLLAQFCPCMNLKTSVWNNLKICSYVENYLKICNYILHEDKTRFNDFIRVFYFHSLYIAHLCWKWWGILTNFVK